MSTKTIDKQTAALVARICQVLPSAMTGDEMQYWIDRPVELGAVLKAGLLVPQIVKIKSHVGPGIYVLTVDKTVESDEAILDAGIAKNCFNSSLMRFCLPVNGGVSTEEAFLYWPQVEADSDLVIGMMEREGYEPIDIWEFAALIKNAPPVLGCDYDVVALGSIGGRGWTNEGGYVPCLSVCRRDLEYRVIEARTYNQVWSSKCRFAVRRKKAPVEPPKSDGPMYPL